MHNDTDILFNNFVEENTSNDPQSEFDRLERIIKQDQLDYISQNIKGVLNKIPDKYHCYCIFVKEFGCMEDFIESFPILMRDFFKEEFANIEEYSQHQYWYGFRGSIFYPHEIFGQMKSILFSAYKNGNQYARSILMNLIKKFYPEEYSYFKRLTQIKYSNIQEMIRIYRDSYCYELEISTYWYCNYMAIVITMVEIFELEINEDCLYCYYAAEEYHKEFNERQKRVIQEYEVDDHFITQAKERLDDKSKKYPIPEEWMNCKKGGYRYLNFADSLERSVFNFLGFGEEYSHICQYDIDPEGALILAEAVMKQKHSAVDFTDNEIQMLAVIVELVYSYTNLVNKTASFMDDFLGMSPIGKDNNPKEDKATVFKDLIPNNTTLKFKFEDKKVGNNKEAIQENSDLQDLTQEIERLRLQIHSKQREYEYLKSLYNDKRELVRKKEDLSEKYESEHAELIQLRNYLYSITENDIEYEKEDVKKYIPLLKNQKVTIIGGHTNWISKLKGCFPNWTYVSFGTSENIDVTVLNKCDMVYFFTDCLSHKMYYKYINEIRKKGILFNYINSVNIDNNIIQFAKDIL